MRLDMVVGVFICGIGLGIWFSELGLLKRQPKLVLTNKQTLTPKLDGPDYHKHPFFLN